MAALGIWLWSDTLSFGLGHHQPLVFATVNRCALDFANVAILGRTTHFHSEILRIISLLLYGVLLIPCFNLVVPICVFLGPYVAWAPISRAIFRIRATSQTSIEEIEQRRYSLATDHYGLWCRAMTAIRLIPLRLGSLLPAPSRLEATPAFLGLVVILALNLVFIIDIEITLGLNIALQDTGEEEIWGFGQILAILLLLLPLRDLVEAILARRLKQRQEELDDDLLEAIKSDSFDRVKLAIERGSTFPSTSSAGHELKFWKIIIAHGAVEYFNTLRHTRMTNTEKGLEADLLYAVERKTEAGGQVLCYAISRGHSLIAEIHARRPGAHVNQRDLDGKTPLILAIEKGNEPIATLLLKNSSISVNLRDATTGWTPLLSAARLSRDSIARIILKRADTQPNATTFKSMQRTTTAQRR
ncbi:ankyrin repeat-containing domain protein [Coprinopsis sp. MPI-PUGE-AT-0042]|nr:ankyrin repeat-containing domain protein [Coprinopsis sp. MPI-PUGE-AT-0042]